MTRRRVVITGLGTVNPLGKSLSETWQNVLAGKSGIGPIRQFDTSAFKVNFGGEVKRYEIRPDPEQLKRYGVTLQQLQTAVSNSNANVGAGYLVQGGTAMNVRGIGLLAGVEVHPEGTSRWAEVLAE